MVRATRYKREGRRLCVELKQNKLRKSISILNFNNLLLPSGHNRSFNKLLAKLNIINSPITTVDPFMMMSQIDLNFYVQN